MRHVNASTIGWKNKPPNSWIREASSCFGLETVIGLQPNAELKPLAFVIPKLLKMPLWDSRPQLHLFHPRGNFQDAKPSRSLALWAVSTIR